MVRWAASLALLAVVTAAASPVRFAADASLLGLWGGGMIYHSNNLTGLGPWASGQLLRLGVGAELKDGLGITAGGMLAQVNILEFSSEPLTARLYWDFDPDQRWRRRTAYVFVTYHHTSFWGDLNYMDPYLEFGAGAAYTFYAITPKIELRLRPGVTVGARYSLLIGFDIGGTYVFDQPEGH